MLHWLISHSLSKVYPNGIDINRNVPKNQDAYFDLGLWDVNGRPFKSFTNDIGLYAVFRIYEKDGVTGKPWTQLVFGKHRHGYGNFNTDKFNLKYDTLQDEKEHSIKVYFTLQNNADYKFKFDLGFYLEPNYGPSGDKVKLVKLLNGDVVNIANGDRNASFLLRKHSIGAQNADGDLGDVDTVFIGYKDDTITDKLNYPYFNNEALDETDTTKNSVFAFGWKKRDSIQGGTKSFGFKVYWGTEFQLQPIVKDISQNLGAVKRNFDLTFNVTEYEHKKVSLYLVDANDAERTTYCGSFIASGDHQTETIKCSASIPEGMTALKYYAYAETESGVKSVNTAFNHARIYDANPPSFTIENGPKNLQEYYYGEDKYITITGTAKVKTGLTFYYKWDERDAVKVVEVLNNKNAESIPFNFNVTFPKSEFHTNQEHTLFIYAEDDLHIKTEENYKFTIKYSTENRPSIGRIFISRDRIEANKDNNIVVFGEAQDPNQDTELKIHVVVDGTDKEIGKFTVTNPPKPFAFPYTLTSRPVGDVNLTFYAVDPENHISKHVTLIRRVWDPSIPQPPEEVGKVIEVSNELKPGSKALFNLKYNDTNGIIRPMTFQNEGFFCQFITYERQSRFSKEGTYLFKHSDNNGNFIKDDFKVEFSTFEEPYTHFLMLNFTVTNLRIFPRRFDLSLFVDSDLAGDEISIENGERGIVVKSNKENVHYTVFTKEYNNYPNVNQSYLGKLDRTGDAELGVDDMPFFINNKGQEANSYGFSWFNFIQGESSIMLAAAFAGFDKVKTPARLIDQTQWNDHYTSSDTPPTLNLRILDAEKNEKIKLVIIENGEETSEIITVEDKEIVYDTRRLKFKPGSQLYTLSITAYDVDESTRFPSNTIEKTIYLTDPPILSINNATIKEWYHNEENIILSGNINDTDATEVQICYQFLHPGSNPYPGPEKIAGTVKKEEFNKEFRFEVEFKRYLSPSDRKWGIRVYAKDREVLTPKYDYIFNVNPRNPPRLFEAGLSKKSASSGESILAYVVFDDKENDFIDIFVKVGSNSQFGDSVAHIDSNPTPGEQYPYAFLWKVPQLNPGVYDVIFEVRDSEGLPSENIAKTLVVKRN